MLTMDPFVSLSFSDISLKVFKQLPTVPFTPIYMCRVVVVASGRGLTLQVC